MPILENEDGWVTLSGEVDVCANFEFVYSHAEQSSRLGRCTETVLGIAEVGLPRVDPTAISPENAENGRRSDDAVLLVPLLSSSRMTATLGVLRLRMPAATTLGVSSVGTRLRVRLRRGRVRGRRASLRCRWLAPGVVRALRPGVRGRRLTLLARICTGRRGLSGRP